MAAFTFGLGHPFPAGTTVQAYEDKGQNASGQPSGSPTASGVVSGTGSLAITGLTEGKRYWAVAQVNGGYRWVGIGVPRDPESLPGETELATGADLSLLDGRLDSVESGRFNVMNYGAKGDGVTDDTAAIQAALTAGAGQTVVLPRLAVFYKVTAKLVVAANTTVEGAGGAFYWDEGGGTLIKKTNGDTGGNCVFEHGADCRFVGLRVEAPDLPYFLAAIYPARPNNPSYGFYTTDGQSTEFERVTAAGFKLAGIGGTGFEIPKLKDVLCYQNLYGVDVTANDVHADGLIVRHNVHTGYRNLGAADTLGVRAEWNGRYGLQLSGRTVLKNPRIERNGWAGIYLLPAAWGCIINGGEVFRNGAGGDGVFGRTAAITTTATDPDGNVMYLAPATEFDKAQIRFGGLQYAILSGTRLVAGADDSGKGARSPKYAYSFDAGNDQVHIYAEDEIGYQRSHINLGEQTGVTAVAATDVFTKNGHGLVAGDEVRFASLTGGAGIVAGTSYFVIAAGLTANNFKVSLAAGGASIDVTSDLTAGTIDTTYRDGAGALDYNPNSVTVRRPLVPEAWREIGAAGQPAFQNSWVNFGSTRATAAFRKEGNLVRVKGLVKNGGGSSAIFTLPLGYRPPTDWFGVGIANGPAAAELQVGTNGVVQWSAGGTNAFLSLESIVFSVV